MGRTKGSKNKPKAQNRPQKSQNRPVEPLIKRGRGRPRKILLNTPVLLTVPKLETLCCICGRVMWGEWQPLSFGKIRHKHNCYPGSKSWAEYYAALPRNQKTEEGNLLLQHYNQGS
mgnify:CR=1 FL=1